MMGIVVFGVCRTSRRALLAGERGGVGGFIDGCRPGDVGVWADQDGVGWSVIVRRCGCRCRRFSQRVDARRARGGCCPGSSVRVIGASLSDSVGSSSLVKTSRPQG